MIKFACIVACLMFLIQGFAFANDKPPVFTGSIARPDGDASKFVPVIGNQGVLLIRSQERLDQILKLVPDLKMDKPLLKTDFSTELLVMVYALGGRSRNSFALHEYDLDAKPPELTFFYDWDNSPERGSELASFKFIFAVIPAAPAVKVTIMSSPMNQDKPVRPVTEFSATLGGKDGGDIVDGLQASITAKAATIKPGEDILIDFSLHLADPGDAKPQQFGEIAKSVTVWDGQTGRGYRNHAFLVTTPDGKTSSVQPQVRRGGSAQSWLPVTITASKAYSVPLNWNVAGAEQSLKTLGLDTSKSGIYTITGVYKQFGQEAVDPKNKDNKAQLWGGSIASNTITVEVKK